MVARTPVPVRLTLCGLFAALSVMTTDPVSVPSVVGVKVTLMAQLAPCATLVPQSLVSAKAGVAVMPEMLSGPTPELVRVTIWGALVVTRFSLPKFRLGGERTAAGLMPVPDRLAI